jgi:hypothetical protein
MRRMSVSAIESLPAPVCLSWGALQWEKDPPATEWDRALVALGGHVFVG